MNQKKEFALTAFTFKYAVKKDQIKKIIDQINDVETDNVKYVKITVACSEFKEKGPTLRQNFGGR